MPVSHRVNMLEGQRAEPSSSGLHETDRQESDQDGSGSIAAWRDASFRFRGLPGWAIRPDNSHNQPDKWPLKGL